MAFPTVTSITETTDLTGADPFLADLPATVDNGDLLVLVTVCNDNAGSTTTPTGWTSLGHVNATEISTDVFYKIADGTEDGGTVSVNRQFNSGIDVSAAQVYRITSWHGTTPPEISTAAGGVNSTLDAGSVTASWGSDDNLFIFLAVTTNDEVAISTWPTSYTTGQTSTLAGDTATEYVRVHSARRELAAASDNPGSCSLASTQSHREWTLVVRPSAGSSETVTISLVDKTGAAQASLSSVSWAWFDEDVGSFNAPTDQGSAETTDGSGEMVLDLSGTSLTSGQIGTLVLYDSTGTKIGAYRLPVD